MKKLTKSLALLLAMLMAFSFSAVAEDTPENYDTLPALTLNAAAEGVIAKDESVFYQFTPEQDGYYGFLTTGGFRSNDGSDYLYVRPIIYDANGKADYDWENAHYQGGETYCVRISADGGSGGTSSVAYTVTPKLYTCASPLKSHILDESDARLLSKVLAGSAYSVKDVELLYARGNLWQDSAGLLYNSNSGITEVRLGQSDGGGLYGAGYLDIYFRNGTYTIVTVNSSANALKLGEVFDQLKAAYESGGISGVISLVFKNLADWGAFIPLLPFLGIFLSFFFAPFSGFGTLFTLLPLSIIAIPFGLLFIPFSLVKLFK